MILVDPCKPNLLELSMAGEFIRYRKIFGDHYAYFSLFIIVPILLVPFLLFFLLFLLQPRQIPDFT